MNVFATTSWRARVGTNLPLVLQNISKQDFPLDKIQVYLSLDEFPHMNNDLPRNLLDVKDEDPRIEFIWTKGNLKSFKRLLAIKNNPNSNLCIYDDDTIFGRDWLKVGFANLAINSSINRVGWISLNCENEELTSLYQYMYRSATPNYYNTSEGYFIHTKKYQNLELDFELPVKLGINDDDYYFHMLNTIYGIKCMPYIYLGKKKLIYSDSDMRNTIYTHKAVLEYWKEHDREKFDLYFEHKRSVVKGLPMIKKKELT